MNINLATKVSCKNSKDNTKYLISLKIQHESVSILLHNVEDPMLVRMQ